VAAIALCSITGSPGVTTTAVGLALCWSRPTVLLEADPTGSSAILAGYLRGQLVPPDALIELVVAHSQGRLRAQISQVILTLPNSQVSLIPGPRSHTQPGALSGLWDPLLAALKDLSSTGQDTIIDLGRLGHEGSATPIVYGADLTLVVTGSDLVSLSGARSRVSALRDQFGELGSSQTLGLVVVGPGRPYSAKEIGDVLQLPVVATVPHEPKTAGAFSRGEQVRKLSNTALVRSLRVAQSGIENVLVAHRSELADANGARP